jgi:hypothetical protein
MISKKQTKRNTVPRWLRRAVAAGWLLAASAGATEAKLPEEAVRAKARALAYSAVESYAVGKYAAASEKLEEAYSLLSVPTLGLWSARTFVKLGKLVEAAERYRAVSVLRVAPSDPAVQQIAKLDAASELEALLPKIPSLEIELSGAIPAEVEIEIDGVRLRQIDLGQVRWVNPGRHEVVGAWGSEKSEVVLNMREGAHEQVWLRFSAPGLGSTTGAAVLGAAEHEDQTRATLRTVGWAALSAGGAGLTTGVVAYLVGDGLHDDFRRRDSCANGACSQAEVDAYNTWRTLHLAGVISGGLLGAAGVSLLIATSGNAAPAESQKDLSVRLAPGSLTVQGTF